MLSAVKPLLREKLPITLQKGRLRVDKSWVRKVFSYTIRSLATSPRQQLFIERNDSPFAGCRTV